jgi:hypothetical protein
MDIVSAPTLVFTIFGMTALVKSLWGAAGTVPKQISPLIPIVVSFVAVFLTAHSGPFGHEALIGKVPLDTMNTAALCLVAIGGAALAAGVHQGLGAVKNIGQNQP